MNIRKGFGEWVSHGSITKLQAPAFAEAASRRQANHQIITKFQ